LVIDEFQEFYNINESVYSDIQNIWDTYRKKSKMNLIVSGSVYSLMQKIFQNNKEPLFASLVKIDLSGIVSFGEKFVGQKKVVNLLLNSGSMNDGLVYGKITLVRYPNHQVRAKSDKYDFDMKTWLNPLNWGRNFETIIGQKVAGQGKSCEINIYGSK
jgi:hypothetical protein